MEQVINDILDVIELMDDTAESEEGALKTNLIATEVR